MDYFTTEIQSSTGGYYLNSYMKLLFPVKMNHFTGTWLLVSQALSTWYRRMVREEDFCQDKLSDIPRYTKRFVILNAIKYDFCRMPIMTYPKGSLTTSSDSQSQRDSSRITTLCPALLTLS